MKSTSRWLCAMTGVVLGWGAEYVLAGEGAVAGNPAGAQGDADGDCDFDLLDLSLILDTFTGPVDGGCCFDVDCNDGDPCTVDSCDSVTRQCIFEPVGNCGVSCELAGSCSLVMECDTPVNGAINPAAENDYLCLCVNEGDTIRVTVSELFGSGASFNPQWRLLDRQGNPAASCGTFTLSAVADCGPLPAAGSPYQLQIQDVGPNDIGLYLANFRRLPATSACEDIPLQCDEVLTETIETSADGDLVSVNVFEGETLRVTVVKQAGSPTGFGVNWRLIDGQGRPSRACGTFSGMISLDCGPLPAAGNPYRVDIEDAGASDMGTYQVHFHRSAATDDCETPLECDVPVEPDEKNPSQATIDEPADADRYRFHVAEAEIVRVSIIEQPGAPSGFGISWRIVDGYGYPAASCGGAATSVSANCGPLPASGNPYRVEIEDGSRTDVGSYVLHLQRLTAARACDDVPLDCGVPLQSMIDSASDDDLFSFSVPDGEQVNIAVVELPKSGANFAPSWRLIDGAGNPAPVCGTFSGSTSQNCADLPAARNPYRVEIEDAGRNDIGNYQVTVTYPITGCSK